MSIFHIEAQALYMTTSNKNIGQEYLPSSFIGLSGHFYILNCFDNNYAYSKWRNKTDTNISTGYMGRVSIQEALSDL